MAGKVAADMMGRWGCSMKLAAVILGGWGPTLDRGDRLLVAGSVVM